MNNTDKGNMVKSIISIANGIAFIARGEGDFDERELSMHVLRCNFRSVSDIAGMNETAAERLKMEYGELLNRLDNRIEAPEFRAILVPPSTGLKTIKFLFALRDIAKVLKRRARVRDTYGREYDDGETDQIAQSVLDLSDALDLSRLQALRIATAFAAALGEIS